MTKDNSYLKNPIPKIDPADFGLAGLQQGQTTSRDYDSPRMPYLTERLEKQMYHVKQEAQKAQALDELNQLLKENPVIARILDLLDALGVK